MILPQAVTIEAFPYLIVFVNHRFYVILSILFTSVLFHEFSPNSMILGTMIPIPKDRKKSLRNSGNYRAIALGSIFSKILDWVNLIKEEMTLCSSDLQFGFEKGTSTTQYAVRCMLYAVRYMMYAVCCMLYAYAVCCMLYAVCCKLLITIINFMESNAFVFMLDASKAFDRVNYCKVFRELLKREMSPLILKLLLFMYTNQTLRLKWGIVMSKSFTVMNGVKQGGVLSPVLFVVYSKITGKWKWMSHGRTHAGALAYADDITLISPSMTGLRKMSSICEQYASVYDILFNGSKSKLLFFKGHCCNVSTLSIAVCGQFVEMSDTAVHLGHTTCITSNDRDNITKSAKSCHWNFSTF